MSKNYRGSAGKLAVIRRLCELQERVYPCIDPRYKKAADCFCDLRDDHENFRDAGHAIDFIERSTKRALAIRKPFYWARDVARGLWERAAWEFINR